MCRPRHCTVNIPLGQRLKFQTKGPPGKIKKLATGKHGGCFDREKLGNPNKQGLSASVSVRGAVNRSRSVKSVSGVRGHHASNWNNNLTALRLTQTRTDGQTSDEAGRSTRQRYMLTTHRAKQLRKIRRNERANTSRWRHSRRVHALHLPAPPPPSSDAQISIKVGLTRRLNPRKRVTWVACDKGRVHLACDPCGPVGFLDKA